MMNLMVNISSSQNTCVTNVERDEIWVRDFNKNGING
jgi:hypothetical protein